MDEVEEYVLRRHNVLAQYIVTRPIMYLCEEVVCRTGTWVSKRWWEQWGLELERERAETESVD